MLSLREGRGLVARLRPHPGSGSTHLPGLLELFHRRLFRRPVKAVGVPGDHLSAFIRDVVIPFVAMALNDNVRAVRLLHTDFSLMGRNGGKGIEGTRKECEGCKNLSHGYWIWTRKPVPPSAISQALPSSTLTTVTMRLSAWVAACLM
jgi:hypothetical protein